jgi:Uncharacterized protein conserved in bacteria (DUF2325)
MTTHDLTKTRQQQAVALCCKHGPAVTQGVSGAHLERDPPAAIAASQSSRRTRLWELPIELHCSIIGVCFSIEALRRLVVKHYKSPCIVGDYEIHSVVVQACSSRTPLIELVQREFDRSFQKEIKLFLTAKSADAVATLWRSAILGEDESTSLAGALWASLTHPRAERALMTAIGHDIHMIQHRVGSDTRRDTQALTQARRLGAERLVALEAARAKLLLAQKQQAHEAAAYRQQVIDAEAALVGAQAQNDALKLQLESLRQSVAQLDSREKLAQRVDDLAEQNARLKQLLTASAERRDSTMEPARDLPPVAMTSDPITPEHSAIKLDNKSVLCVGGRSSAVVLYRKAVERAGGKFLHHDGGIEHNHHRLDANLAAADCVVCQTACVSHTAYWMVKDYCKKTGKQCVYLDRTSMSSFVEGLGMLPRATKEPLAAS